MADFDRLPPILSSALRSNDDNKTPIQARSGRKHPFKHAGGAGTASLSTGACEAGRLKIVRAKLMSILNIELISRLSSETPTDGIDRSVNLTDVSRNTFSANSIQIYYSHISNWPFRNIIFNVNREGTKTPPFQPVGGNGFDDKTSHYRPFGDLKQPSSS